MTTDYSDAVFVYLRELVKRLFGLCVKEVGPGKIVIAPNALSTSTSVYLELSIDYKGHIKDDKGNSFDSFTTDLKSYLVKELYPKIPEWSRYMYEFQKSFTEIEDLYFGSSRVLLIDEDGHRGITTLYDNALILPCQVFFINGKLKVEIYHATRLCYVYCRSIGIEKELYNLEISIMDDIAGQILFDILYTHNGAEIIL